MYLITAIFGILQTANSPVASSQGICRKSFKSLVCLVSGFLLMLPDSSLRRAVLVPNSRIAQLACTMPHFENHAKNPQPIWPKFSIKAHSTVAGQVLEITGSQLGQPEGLGVVSGFLEHACLPKWIASLLQILHFCPKRVSTQRMLQ